ncbi:predicted protein [Naegleria gruberi]|uniref:Predicted protein n=1 Tax=Naegleria gruberi TaxID=5762 RepID=D2VUV4_NAEGR|nr:uncharacterized protein NAEGRDRAFT_72798 [Naegleria gruberi]EFC39330.1 predicted protein [Naegleria gruberi]|eukprot:XP_002672074.1 predicted protein [Naegleria gruberi strain NEG-M]
MLPSSCFGYSNWSGRATDDDDFESFLYSPTNEEQINTSEEINLNMNNSINTTDRNQHQSICQNNTVPVQSINSSSMVEKNEYTCLSCRKLHRKCDKLLPSCSYCSKRGYNCIYEKPKRSVKPNQPNFVFVDEGRKLTNHRISQPTAATTNKSISLW